ncbi:MAG: hypothetical protein AAF889_08400 [Cyanobacteria bacterium P01_D01_bin.73]
MPSNLAGRSLIGSSDALKPIVQGEDETFTDSIHGIAPSDPGNKAECCNISGRKAFWTD